MRFETRRSEPRRATEDALASALAMYIASKELRPA
jgi:hypothetical protein